MTQINLEEVKKQAVHDGILEAICLLRETRNKVNSLILDEEVTCVIDAEGQLIRMSNSLCNFTTELSGIVGVIFSDRGRLSLKTWGNPKSCFGFKRKLIKVAFTHCMY